ncbi:MAG: aminopeptidase P family protein [Pseudomonadota bacterium]
MFQDFSAPAASDGDRERIDALRIRMKQANLSGFIVPRADEHQGEYVPASAERLKWLTGFTGSAGSAAILEEKAAIFIDGRYTLQVRSEVDTDVIDPVPSMETPLKKWLSEEAGEGNRIGYDPWLHTVKEAAALRKALESKGAVLVASENLVDAIWENRPAPPLAPVQLHPADLAGKPATEKIARFQEDLREHDADAFLLTAPDSICWLFNIRGRDVPHTPLVLSFALVPMEGKPMLFVEPEKLDELVRQDLDGIADLLSKDALLASLKDHKGALALDPAHASDIFRIEVKNSGGRIVEASDPCLLPKARKNTIECEGARAAHIRDGIAVAQFLAWLDRTEPSDIDEIEAARKLEAYRVQVGERTNFPLEDISFDTISGFGPNGAIVHYRVTEATNRQFEKDTLYLIDSGGQYRDGTTDITRTVAIGTPSEEMRKHFTLVLKGMIAISRLRFPKGTTGGSLDAFARHALWQAGLDFDHGTGHGVGSFLSVHEGPQRLSKASGVKLEPGMILSNEPGFYQADSYGIRIENLILVTEPEDIDGGDRAMMGFETLTFAPIDRALISLDLIDERERAWIDHYHEEVLQKIGASLEGDDLVYLQDACAPL